MEHIAPTESATFSFKPFFIAAMDAYISGPLTAQEIARKRRAEAACQDQAVDGPPLPAPAEPPLPEPEEPETPNESTPEKAGCGAILEDWLIEYRINEFNYLMTSHHVLSIFC